MKNLIKIVKKFKNKQKTLMTVQHNTKKVLQKLGHKPQLVKYTL